MRLTTWEDIEASMFTIVPQSEEADESIKQSKGKLPISLCPTQIIRDIAAVRAYGTSTKYPDTESYKRVNKRLLLDATQRHLLEYTDNPSSINEESGLTHLAHAACNIALLCEIERIQK